MVRLLKRHNKAVILSLLALTIAGSLSQGRSRRSTREIFVRGDTKVYALITPYMISKSMDQMQNEATAGRSHFQAVFAKGPDASKNLLSIMTPVKDQGHRGTCVAFASVALVEAQVRAAKGSMPNFSEQYIYWASKAIEKVDPNSDGSEPVDMLKTFERQGTPVQQAWPYEPNPWFADQVNHKDCFNAYKANPDNVPTECVTNGDPSAQAKSAPRVTVTHEMEVGSSPEAIVGYIENGIPVEVGLDVYQHAWSFDNPKSPNFKAGVVEMPAAGDKVIGGHAILIVGYDKNAQVYLFKNSWGTNDWAVNSRTPGFGTIPMNYVRKFGQAVVAKVTGI